MDLTFDYYHNLEDVDFYLCNPDGRELFPLTANDRTVTLRFNSISELSFTIDSTIPDMDGNIIDVPYYEYVEVKRLIHVSHGIGWFQINSVTEKNDGIHKTKSVKAESLECVFKNIGILTEKRVYKFYDPADPRDDTYDLTNYLSVPSVVGQICQQLGINIDLTGSGAPYDDWTITEITSSLAFDLIDPVCRTFDDETIFAYDFMVNKVQEAFKIVTIFDIENKTIHFRSVEEVTRPSDVCLSFDNVIDEMNIDEDSSNIATILNCNGNGIDITSVNPMATNYIANFDYYMDEQDHRWMSQELINALKTWRSNYNDGKTAYGGLVGNVYAHQKNSKQLEALLQQKKIFTEDLNNAAAKLIGAKAKDESFTGIIKAEHIRREIAWKSSNTHFEFTNKDEYLWGYMEISTQDFGGKKKIFTQPLPITDKEEAGDVISNVKDYYLVAAKNLLVTRETPGWQLTFNSATFGIERPFVWHYRKITCSNGEIETDPDLLFIYHESETVDEEDGTTTTYPSFTTSPSIYTYYCVKMRESGVNALPYRTVGTNSYFKSNALLGTTVIPVAYTESPTYDSTSGTFSFVGTGVRNKTIDQLFAEVENDPDWNKDGHVSTAHLYFLEPPLSGTVPADGARSYLKLTGEGVRIPDETESTGYKIKYECTGADRYTTYDDVNIWWSANEAAVQAIEDLLLDAKGHIHAAETHMKEISGPLNIRTFVRSQPNGAKLLRELQCYWIESTYENNNIAEAKKNSEFTDVITLATHLMKRGEKELAKISKPAYSFTISARAAHRCYELYEFIKNLKLGCVTTIERGDSPWFYPALIEMSFSLDSDNFNLSFANSARLTDPTFTFAQLITDSASVSRKVASNWADLTSYVEDKESIEPAVLDPLNSALRAAKSALANVGNQEFQVDSNGILGRRRTADGEEFSDEQIRIINNIIAFTNDKWENVKTALGNITLTETDRAGNTTQTNAYGLVADAIVGSLIIGNTLRINNNDNSIVIDKNGISITTGNNQQTFKATNDGDLYLSGRADVSGNIEGDKVVTNLIESRTGETSIKLNADVSGARELTAFLTASLENLHPKFTIVIKNASGNLQQITSSREFAIRYEDGYGASHAITCRVPSGANGAYIVEPEFQTMFVRNAVFMDSTSDELTFNDNGGSVDTTYTATLSYHNLTGGYQELDLALTAGVGAVELQREMTFYVQYQDEFGTWKSTICRMMPGDVNYTMELGTDPRIVDYRFWSISSAYTITPNTNGRQATFVQTVQLDTSVGVEIKGSLLPNSGTNYDIGSSSKKWNNIYAKTGTIQTSARASKVDISDLDDSHNDELFDNLRPRKFKMADGTSGRTHYGFILDELGDAIEASGLTPEECAAYCLQDVEDPNGLGGIRYSEFIALNTLQIQKLKARIAELEEQCKK